MKTTKAILAAMAALTLQALAQLPSALPSLTGADFVIGSDQIQVRDVSVPTIKWMTGTELKIGMSLNNVENTALTTWAGTTSLTTLGTVTTGTWNGTAIAIANGGTGATTAAGARTNLGLVIGTDVVAPNQNTTGSSASLALSGGGTVTGASGSISLAASGTNQSITITPSGTGVVQLGNATTGFKGGTYNTAGAGGLFFDSANQLFRLSRSSGGSVMVDFNLASNTYDFSGAVYSGGSGFTIGSGGVFRASSSSVANSGSWDTGMSRGSAGQWLFGTGGAGSFAGSIKTTNGEFAGTLAITGITTATGGVQLGTKTVSGLPTASTNAYLEFVVTDALAPAAGSTVAAGGSAKCKVMSNGTNWICTTPAL